MEEMEIRYRKKGEEGKIIIKKIKDDPSQYIIHEYIYREDRQIEHKRWNIQAPLDIVLTKIYKEIIDKESVYLPTRSKYNILRHW